MPAEPEKVEPPGDAAPTPGDTLRLPNGRTVSVLVVAPDREHPGRVTVIAQLEH